MNILKGILLISCCALSFLSNAQEQEEANLTPGYISDDLFIYMHKGPGTNYRIGGSVNAGDEISLTGKEENGFTEIIDPKGRVNWVESKFVSANAGLRQDNERLKTQLEEQDTLRASISNDLTSTQQQLASFESDKKESLNQIASLEQEIIQLKSQLKNQDWDQQKFWFFNGAIVLGVGLLLGILIPLLGRKKKAGMSEWK